VDSMFQKQCRFRDTIYSMTEKSQFLGFMFPQVLQSRAGNNRFDGWMELLWRIENQRGSIRPWLCRPVASHCTAYNSSDHE